MWFLIAGVCGLSASPALRGNLGIHDPSTIIKCQDKYYLFGTGQGIISKSSSDKVFWKAGPSVFASPPAWTTNAVPGFTGLFWAPDIFFLNGRYCLYYAVSSWASQVSAIGLVTNSTLDSTDPAYKWTDQGMVIQSGNGSPFNTIDPSVALDAAGNPWMAFGSYWNGIYLVQLDPATGLRIAPGSPTYRLAYNSSIEASCLFRHGGYYYLFVNWGSCCSGVNSTYHIRVGRSTSITGPYLDRNGVNLANNGGSLFLQGTGKFTGPGHVGILSEGGAEWLSYHYYDAGDWDGGAGAFGKPKFDLIPLSWTSDNWPVFTNDWSAVYHFQADARDENSQYYGLMLGGASAQTDPVRGRVLNLNGTNQFVQLPPGVAYARTFSAVVKWNGGSAWQRLFDFGTDTSSYIMLTPSSGTGKLRCDLRANGTTQVLEGPSALPVGVWAHVAVTLDGQKGVLYLNGQAVATNASMTLSPLDVRAQTNHLGHSKFVADPDFSGRFANFRVYGRALSAAEIVAPLPVIAQPAQGATYQPGDTVAFAGGAADFFDQTIAATGLTWTVQFCYNGATNPVQGALVGVTNGTFTIPGSGVAATNGFYRVGLTATDAAGRKGTAFVDVFPGTPATPSWASYYPFTTGAQDASNRFNGSLLNGASIATDATRGKVLNLGGGSQYVSLPAGAGNFQTFSAWVKWNGGGAWQRIVDFG
ncbi:MAG TPA: family 43 glycosylhydrolase, partial [Bacillota bacterium]|nr:family 43 glycosylhydrolase [Bacillota bacterium]